jgi:lysozyme
MRAQKDINLRADRNINIEAGQNIYMKAAKDTITSTTEFTYDVNNVPKPATIPYYEYVGEGDGEGGNIVVQALGNMHTTVDKDSFITVRRDLNLNVTRDYFITVGRNNTILVENNYTLTSHGKQDYKSVGDIHMQTDAEFDLKATGNINVQTADTYNLVAATDIDMHATSNVNIIGDIGISSKGTTYDVQGIITLGGIVGISGNLTAGGPLNIIGNAVVLGGSATVPVPPAPTNATDASDASLATEAAIAEIKQQVEKINILATWSDPESKFKRNSASMSTTVSTLPTYEPCPEHETFSFKAISGYTPKQTEASRTYNGSGGAGNDAVASPPTNTTPGANNTDIPPTNARESAITKDINMSAYECQLKIHEGVRYVSYLDSVGLPTGGIGHLLRQNEISMFPVPTPIPAEQVSTWFNQDAPISIMGAQKLLGLDVWGDLTDIRKRACADLCYNLGEARLSKFVRFIAAMKAGDYDLAGRSLRESKWFTQVGRRGPNIVTMIVQNIDPNGCDAKFPA